MPERLAVHDLLAIAEHLAVEAESRVRKARTREHDGTDYATQLRVDAESIAGVSRAFSALATARLQHVTWLDMQEPRATGREPAPQQEGAPSHV